MRGPPTVAGMAPEELRARLRDPGVAIDLGACAARFRTGYPGFAPAMRALYGAFPIEADESFADATVSLEVQRTVVGSRLARLIVDGESPFDPMPLSMHPALVEWGLNWTIAYRSHAWLMLHAGVVARGDRALLMPAYSGVGKSTLTAALMCHGYRLISDEFCAIDPHDGTVMPLLRPVCLKNDSIDRVVERWPGLSTGPRIAGTRKGTVLHVAPNAMSVAARKRPAQPEFVVFPRYGAAEAPALEPIASTRAFVKLSGNSFNYALLGETGFLALTNLVAQCRSYQLRYSRFEDAFDLIDALFAETEVAAPPIEPARR